MKTYLIDVHRHPRQDFPIPFASWQRDADSFGQAVDQVTEDFAKMFPSVPPGEVVWSVCESPL